MGGFGGAGWFQGGAVPAWPVGLAVGGAAAVTGRLLAPAATNAATANPPTPARRCADVKHANKVATDIKVLRSAVMQRDRERAERATLVAQEKLARGKRVYRLPDLWVRPSLGGKGRKQPGALEAHANGFRCAQRAGGAGGRLCTALRCTVLCCSRGPVPQNLHCTARAPALHCQSTCTALHCTALHCTAPDCSRGPVPQNLHCPPPTTPPPTAHHTTPPPTAHHHHHHHPAQVHHPQGRAAGRDVPQHPARLLPAR